MAVVTFAVDGDIIYMRGSEAERGTKRGVTLLEIRWSRCRRTITPTIGETLWWVRADGGGDDGISGRRRRRRGCGELLWQMEDRRRSRCCGDGQRWMVGTGR